MPQQHQWNNVYVYFVDDWSRLHCTLKANSHIPCRVHAVPLSCHAASLPFSDSAVSFVKVRVVAGNIQTVSPTVYRISMLLITTFVEIRVVAGRSRKRAGRQHSVSGRPISIYTCHAHAHAALCCGLEKSLSERHGRDMARERHGMCQNPRITNWNDASSWHWYVFAVFWVVLSCIYRTLVHKWHVRIGNMVFLTQEVPASNPCSKAGCNDRILMAFLLKCHDDKANYAMATYVHFSVNLLFYATDSTPDCVGKLL
jgi:hypothetical protein